MFDWLWKLKECSNLEMANHVRLNKQISIYGNITLLFNWFFDHNKHFPDGLWSKMLVSGLNGYSMMFIFSIVVPLGSKRTIKLGQIHSVAILWLKLLKLRLQSPSLKSLDEPSVALLIFVVEIRLCRQTFRDYQPSVFKQPLEQCRIYKNRPFYNTLCLK